MWRRLVKPETLFFIGSALAVSPYLRWVTQGTGVTYFFDFDYRPLYVWAAGYLAFWLGCKCLPFRVPSSIHPLVTRPEKYATLCRWMLLILAVQVLALIRVYGGIPLLAYINGSIDVQQVDEAVRNRAFPGQMGLMLQSLFVLNGLLLILIVSGDQRNPRRQRFLFLSSLFLAAFASTLSGKRQGLLITIFFVAVGLSIARRQPIRPVLSYLRLPLTRQAARIALIAVPAALVVLMGTLATLRSGEQIPGIVEVTRYVEIPLMNFQTQISASGLTPDPLHPKQMLAGMVPARMATGEGERPVRAEPTAPAGFYGEIHWAIGTAGVLAFAFLAGLMSKYFYRRAHKSIFHLLVYSQLAWTLFGACLYNHFLYLNFFWAPLVCFWLVARLDRRPRRRRAVPIPEMSLTPDGQAYALASRQPSPLNAAPPISK